MNEEQVYFRAGELSVSRQCVVSGAATIPVRSIASTSVVVDHSWRRVGFFCGVALVAAGIVFALLNLPSLFWPGVALGGLCVLASALIPPRYVLLLATAGGPVRALVTADPKAAGEALAAVNEAVLPPR